MRRFASRDLSTEGDVVLCDSVEMLYSDFALSDVMTAAKHIENQL
jgi:hypothetical protein